MVAAVSGDIGDGEEEEFAEAVAALNIKGKKFQHKKADKGGAKPGGGGSSSNASGGDGGRNYFVCDRHWKYGEKAYRCDIPSHCQWQGN